MRSGAPSPPRLRGPRGRGLAALAGALGVVASGALAAAPAPAGAEAPASHRQVVLLGDHVARTRPSPRARRIETVAGRRPLTRVRTVLPVLGRARSRDGRSWLQVRLPGRPNARKGWIAGARTRPASTPWRITVRLSSRLVVVHHHGRIVRRFRAVVGAPSTPTPRGRFFVEEGVRLAAGAQGGPYALATSARSDVLQEFNGGPGQIALHGTGGLPGVAGSAVSHGCVRLSPGAITWLARRIGAGVPLTVTR